MKVKKYVRNISFISFIIGLLMLTGLASNSEINSLSAILIYSTISMVLSVPYMLIFINELKEVKE